jgi:hypothetical protein
MITPTIQAFLADLVRLHQASEYLIADIEQQVRSQRQIHKVYCPHCGLPAVCECGCCTKCHPGAFPCDKEESHGQDTDR